MCLPGTVEKVRGQVQENGTRRIDRRTALLSGLGAAAALTVPGVASAGRPRDRDHGHKKDRLQDLTHVFFAGFPVFSFDPPKKRTLVTIPSGGFFSPEGDFGENPGTPHDAPRHLLTRGPPPP